MINGIQERTMNNNQNTKIKLYKYPCVSSVDILDHVKPSLRKEPPQITIHAGINDVSNDVNYLKNVKEIVKLVKETCKNTKLYFCQ